MRYLTHETEDNFWTSHGARPHPLAKAEAEKKNLEQQRQQQQDVLESSVNMNQIFNSAPLSQESDHLANGRQVSNGSVVLGNSEVFADSYDHSNVVKRGEELKPEDVLKAGTREEGSNSSKKNRKDYISMTDDEILKAEQHAKRVGYKVSTV